MLVSYARNEQPEILDEVVEPADQGTWPIRAAVPAMVDRVDGIAFGHQPLSHVGVATAVLGGSVHEQRRADRRRVWIPAPPEEACRVYFGAEPPVTVGSHDPATPASSP
jgi:hypothetical protein